MSKKMLIDATHSEETRVVVVDGNKVEEFDFETVNKRQLAGNIYLAKVTRVEPSLQAAFVDYGGNRHGFLAFAEIHPDYYQIPVADRKALLEEERAYARAEEEEENRRSRRKPARSPKPAATNATGADPVRVSEISGMDVVDLGDELGADALVEDVHAEASVHETAPEAVPAFVAEAQEGDGHSHDDHGHDDHSHEGHGHDGHSHDGDDGFGASDRASANDDEIESIAEEDLAEEISQPRKPRPRRYKIQEVVKVRQIMLVQVVKEERGNKGAALTTYLSLAGRYCVLMPNTARGGGISRKITQSADRKKLKEIAAEMEVPEGAGLIIRTAGAKRTKAEIKRDYEYLMRLWEQIRELTLKSVAPAKIYEEGDLIKRSIRDLYSREIDEVLVEGEAGFRTAKDFMRMIMPSHARQVVRYSEQMPLFARYQVESYLGGMFNPVVQLKSGGYIVIGVTEALVAIDVNSGRATKEGSIEETAVKTNLEAAEEIARQLRLRDLAGLIVIDFIDMEERRNNAAVEKRLKDKLKTDRARIQVGRISGFGLMEMSRQRLRPGMLESTTQPCSHCHGTGLIRSDDSLGLQILRALEEEGTRKRSKEVLLKAPIGIVNFLINQKREHIALIEARYGMSVRIECDPAMISPDYLIEKFKTATRVVPEPSTVISVNPDLMGAPVDDEDEDFVEDVIDEVEDEIAEDQAGQEEAGKAEASPAAEAAQGNGKKKRRRRRRRKGGNGPDAAQAGDDEGDVDGDVSDSEDEAEAEDKAEIEAAAVEEAGIDVVIPAIAEVVTDAMVEVAADAAPAEVVSAEDAPKPKRTRKPSAARTRRTKASEEAAAAPSEAVPAAPEAAPETPVEVAAEAPAPKKPRARRPRTVKAEVAAVSEGVVEAGSIAPEVAPVIEAAPAEVIPVQAPIPAPVEVVAETVTAPAFPVDPGLASSASEAAGAGDSDGSSDPDDSDKPKRRGWWSLAR